MAIRTYLGKAVAGEAVDGVFAAVEEAPVSGEEVRTAGFGTFGIRNRPAHTGRNPGTGEAVSILASISPTFKAGRCREKPRTANLRSNSAPIPNSRH